MAAPGLHSLVKSMWAAARRCERHRALRDIEMTESNNPIKKQLLSWLLTVMIFYTSLYICYRIRAKTNLNEWMI